MGSKIRSAVFTAPAVAFATALYGSASLVVSVFSSTGRTQHRIAKAWAARLLQIAGVKVELHGLEKIAPGGSYVFVANHRSYFDVPVILPQIPVQFRFMANKNLFRIPFLGYHMSRAGYFSVNSENARESLKSMSDAARLLQTRGVSILVFPEGGRTYGEMDPFKDGAAYIAIKAGVPIVPIGLKGLREILPRGGSTINSGNVVMRIGDPIPTLDLTLGDRTALTQQLERCVAELAGQSVRTPVGVS
jgi:1-acyl-sn-glycerol-3-phosphate acyltransferase